MLYKCFVLFCPSECSTPLSASEPSSSNIAISFTKKFLTQTSPDPWSYSELVFFSSSQEALAFAL